MMVFDSHITDILRNICCREGHRPYLLSDLTDDICSRISADKRHLKFFFVCTNRLLDLWVGFLEKIFFMSRESGVNYNLSLFVCVCLSHPSLCLSVSLSSSLSLYLPPFSLSLCPHCFSLFPLVFTLKYFIRIRVKKIKILLNVIR